MIKAEKDELKLLRRIRRRELRYREANPMKAMRGCGNGYGFLKFNPLAPEDEKGCGPCGAWEVCLITKLLYLENKELRGRVKKLKELLKT